MKKILLLHINFLRFEKYIAQELKNRGHYVEEYNVITDFRYEYKGKADRIRNFFSKLFLNHNVKTTYRNKLIENKLTSDFDVVFITRPDILTKKHLKIIEKSSYKKITYLYDGVDRLPKTRIAAEYFDEVYSYQKSDCEKYGYKFITNFIYNEQFPDKKDFVYEIFMIFKYDFRFSILEKIGKILSDKKLSYKFIVVDPDKRIETKYCEYSKTFLSLEEVSKLAHQSKILLDLQRDDQQGLSFRPFEALGLHKKLITTNKDIVNYDFYNPNNILVIDENSTEIPDAFFITPYEEVPDEILNKYRISTWVETVFGNDL